MEREKFCWFGRLREVGRVVEWMDRFDYRSLNLAVGFS